MMQYARLPRSFNIFSGFSSREANSQATTPPLEHDVDQLLAQEPILDEHFWTQRAACSEYLAAVRSVLKRRGLSPKAVVQLRAREWRFVEIVAAFELLAIDVGCWQISRQIAVGQQLRRAANSPLLPQSMKIALRRRAKSI